jgi:hypothetical protein
MLCRVEGYNVLSVTTTIITKQEDECFIWTRHSEVLQMLE